MDERTQIAAEQLTRMRGMTAMYHRRFFLDINVTTVLILVLFVVGWFGAEPAFLLIPVVALIGAVQTAFDSSYLTFARWYAVYLERYLNERLGSRVLVAAELESAYLFELGSPKIVTIPLAGGFSWFSFVTVFYTVIGALAFVFGLALGWEVLADGPVALMALYLLSLLAVTLAALLVGTWWFVTGAGERRLSRVLEERFGEAVDTSGPGNSAETL